MQRFLCILNTNGRLMHACVDSSVSHVLNLAVETYPGSEDADTLIIAAANERICARILVYRNITNVNLKT